jgi:hypothetical protein
VPSADELRAWAKFLEVAGSGPLELHCDGSR